MPAFHYAISLAVSVVPALLLLAFFRRLDRTRPVPRRSLYATMALGAAACAPAALLEWLEHAVLGDACLVGGRFVDAFVVAAITEESLKLIVVLGYPFRRSAFEEIIDGVVFTVAAGLGFGLLENLAFSVNDVGTGVARAITAVPMHALTSGVMGYFVGRARFTESSNNAFPLVIVGLVMAVGIHGSYDWAIFNHDSYWWLESMAVLVVASGLLATLARHALVLDESMLGRQSMTAFLNNAWPTNVTQTIVPSNTQPDSARSEP